MSETVPIKEHNHLFDLYDADGFLVGLRGGGEMKEWIVCADKPTRAMERMRVGDVVRCRDCASIKPTTDGRHYCQRWSNIVPLDGFCWRGEAKSGEEAQEG